MGLLTLLIHNPVAFFALAVPLLYSIICHEVAHGWVALLFGDDTAKSEGRLTLNPVPHLDPVGTLALFLVGFGWARPVPIDYTKMRHLRPALIAVSLAGCVANILIATLAILLLQLPFVARGGLVVTILIIVVKINIMLGAFNLIPIPPLDGSRILMALLPPRQQYALYRLEPYGMLIVFALLFTGLLNPVIGAIEKTLLFVITALLKMG